MRTLLIAGTAVAALLGSGPAVASERMVQPGPGVMHGGWHGPRPTPPMGPVRTPRWGSKVNGRWWGGVNAPGGWSAYRRPVRGWALPVYWNTPRFYVTDWSTYGLTQPQYGYHWVRYYDDAVLVDGNGSVYDSRGDVNWDGYDAYADEDDRVYAGGDSYAPPPPPPPAYRDDHGYAPPPPEYRDNRGYERRDNGVGGALAGAAVGGVAGALIAGKHDRVGGALIGAGVGGVAGYAIDKAEDRGRRPGPPPPPPGYGANYPPPPPMHGAYPPPPPRPYPAPGGRWVSPDGSTTVVTTGGGYGGSVTTVTVQTAPVVTTTTTEIYEDHVTWSRPAVRRKVWKPRRRVVCSCR